MHIFQSYHKKTALVFYFDPPCINSSAEVITCHWRHPLTNDSKRVWCVLMAGLTYGIYGTTRIVYSCITFTQSQDCYLLTDLTGGPKNRTTSRLWDQFGFWPTGNRPTTTCALNFLIHHVTNMLQVFAPVRCLTKAFIFNFIRQKFDSIYEKITRNKKNKIEVQQ